MPENILLKQIFGKDSLQDVTVTALEQLTQQYPFFAAGHLLLAKKQPSAPFTQKAVLYVADPIRVQQFLSSTPKESSLRAGKPAIPWADNDENIREENAVTGPAQDTPVENPVTEQVPESKPVQPATEELIQPLFARDYFASQGIKLPEILKDDKRPTMAQLRSFTDWLRTTKRPRPAADPDLVSTDKEAIAAIYEREEDGSVTSEVAKMAINSVKYNEEIVTEAMAEVRVKQGQADKAIHIYEKLGLLNPEKSSYFADKIAEIKHSNL